MRAIGTGVMAVAALFATAGPVSTTGAYVPDQSESLACVVVPQSPQYLLLPAAAAQDCSSIEDQLERDTNAMRRQHDSILQNSDELEEWDDANKKALKDAAKDAAKLIAGRLAKTLLAKQKALRGLQDRLIKNAYRSRFGAQGPQYIANVTRQLEEANRAYDRMKAQVDIGHILKTAVTAEDIKEMINKTIKAVGDAQAQSDAVINAAIRDPELSSFFEADHAASEFAQQFTEMALEAARIIPHVDVASFVVNTAYNAKKWQESRDRILQQVELSEKDLQAVNALKAQIERTAGRLKQCRADLQARQSQPQQPPSQVPQVQLPPQAPAPEPVQAPSNSGNAATAGGGGGGMGVGSVVGLAAGGIGAAVGGKMLADYAEKQKCNQYETQIQSDMNSFTTAANNAAACSTQTCFNQRIPAVNNAISKVLATAGEWCTCLGPSAASDIPAADKAAVRAALSELRSLGVTSGTLPACFR